MKGLVESIDLVDENGDVMRKFFGLEYLEGDVEKPFINHYTFDFKFIEKFDKEVRENMINSAKGYENFDLIKDNLEKATICSSYSDCAESVVKKYRSDLRLPFEKTINGLIFCYKAKGFGGR